MSEQRTLADSVHLSNKACPRHYTGRSRKCFCPFDRCWYDEQQARRRLGLLAIDPEDWPEPKPQMRDCWWAS